MARRRARGGRTARPRPAGLRGEDRANPRARREDGARQARHPQAGALRHPGVRPARHPDRAVDRGEPRQSAQRGGCLPGGPDRRRRRCHQRLRNELRRRQDLALRRAAQAVDVPRPGRDVRARERRGRGVRAQQHRVRQLAGVRHEHWRRSPQRDRRERLEERRPDLERPGDPPGRQPGRHQRQELDRGGQQRRARPPQGPGIRGLGPRRPGGLRLLRPRLRQARELAPEPPDAVARRLPGSGDRRLPDRHEERRTRDRDRHDERRSAHGLGRARGAAGHDQSRLHSGAQRRFNPLPAAARVRAADTDHRQPLQRHPRTARLGRSPRRGGRPEVRRPVCRVRRRPLQEGSGERRADQQIHRRRHHVVGPEEGQPRPRERRHRPLQRDRRRGYRRACPRGLPPAERVA